MIMATKVLSLRRLTSGPRKPILEEQKGITPLVSASAARVISVQAMTEALKTISGCMIQPLMHGRKKQTSADRAGKVRSVLVLAARAISAQVWMRVRIFEMISGNMTQAPIN